MAKQKNHRSEPCKSGTCAISLGEHHNGLTYTYYEMIITRSLVNIHHLIYIQKTNKERKKYSFPCAENSQICFQLYHMAMLSIVIMLYIASLKLITGSFYL